MDTAVDAAVIRSGATSFPNRGADRGSTTASSSNPRGLTTGHGHRGRCRGDSFLRCHLFSESPRLDHGAQATASSSNPRGLTTGPKLCIPAVCAAGMRQGLFRIIRRVQHGKYLRWLALIGDIIALRPEPRLFYKKALNIGKPFAGGWCHNKARQLSFYGREIRWFSSLVVEKLLSAGVSRVVLARESSCVAYCLK